MASPPAEIAYHPIYNDYGVDARGRPVSRRVVPCGRPLRPHRRRDGKTPTIDLRHRGQTLRYSLPAFAAECRRGSAAHA